MQIYGPCRRLKRRSLSSGAFWADRALLAHSTTAGLLRLVLPLRLQRRGPRTWTVGQDGQADHRNTALDHTLIKALRTAHQLMTQADPERLGKLEGLIPNVAPKSPYHRNLCRIAFLAPDIQAMILQGAQPPFLTLQDLMTRDIPPAWDDQRRMLGLV